MKKVIRRISLKQMPFDRFDDEKGFIHATGYDIQLEDGSWEREYEDDDYEDADDCVYESEWDEEWEDDEDDDY